MSMFQCSLLLGTFSGWEFIAVLVLILLLFGPKRIPDLMKSLGKGVSSFKEGVHEVEKEVHEASKDKEEDKKD